MTVLYTGIRYLAIIDMAFQVFMGSTSLTVRGCNLESGRSYLTLLKEARDEWLNLSTKLNELMDI